MQTSTIKELKQELSLKSKKELLDICLLLSKFKKENKEYLTYILFESENETLYIENIKSNIDEDFRNIKKTSNYLTKKSVRKILSSIKKYIRYSKNKETEVELLIYFCQKLRRLTPAITNSYGLQSIYKTQIESIKKTILKLHEDLQFDYNQEIEELIKK